jgi:type II secretion system protein J
VSKKNRQKAFSLIELLAAMALMAVLATALYGSLRIGFKARRSAEAAVEPVRRVQIALCLARQDIEAALPPKGILAREFYGTDQVDNRGYDSDSLLFCTSNYKPYPGETGCDIIQVELALVPSVVGINENVLVRRITTNLLASSSPEPIEEILCRGVKSFNLGYFDGYEWQDSWDSVLQGNALPQAVEITLTIETADTDTNTISQQQDYQFTRTFVIPCSSPANEQRE